jgi:hypothetical protein
MRDILSEILKRIKNAKNLTVEAVATGQSIEDFAKYQRILGEIAGLEKALMIIDGILTEDEEDKNL